MLRPRWRQGQRQAKSHAIQKHKRRHVADRYESAQCRRGIACEIAMAWVTVRPGQASRRRAEPPISDQVPPTWRAPEGPEGTGWLRDRPLRAFRLACGNLADGWVRRCPENQRHHKHQHAARTAGLATAGTPARGPLHPLRGATPVTARDTRYGARHPIRRGALPTDRVQRTQSQEQTRNLQDDRRHAQGPESSHSRGLNSAAAQPTLHVAPSRPSATVMPAAARRSRSSSARAQSLAARAAARSSRTA